MSDHKNTRKTITSVFITLVITCLLLTACGTSPTEAKSYTIGIVHSNPVLDAVLEGFKAGMTDLGYVEGKNVTYVFDGVLANDAAVIDTEVQKLMGQKVDMLFTLGTIATLSAKKGVEGTDVPVVFAPVINPVEEGVVESISLPGGNVTGVQRGNYVAKSLEWLLKVAPGTQKVYLFYNPADMVTVSTMQPLPGAAASLGVEFMPIEVTSIEKVLTIIPTLPEDSAIFYVPAPSIDPEISRTIAATIEYGVPLGSYVANDVNAGVLVGYGGNWAALGQQAARMADQIFKGTKPANMPIETDEAFLNINMKTANAIGLTIPDEILGQADTIVR